jgi:hypothetical protein
MSEQAFGRPSIATELFFACLLEADPEPGLHLAARSLLKGARSALTHICALLGQGSVNRAHGAVEIPVQQISWRVIRGAVEDVEGVEAWLHGELLGKETVMVREPDVGQQQQIEPDFTGGRIGEVRHDAAETLQLRRGDEALRDKEVAGGRGFTGIDSVVLVDHRIETGSALYAPAESSGASRGKQIVDGAVSCHVTAENFFRTALAA